MEPGGAGGRIAGTALVIGGTAPQRAARRKRIGRRPGLRRWIPGSLVAATPVVEPGVRLDFVSRRPEELGEAPVGLQVAAHQHRVVGLECLGHAVHQGTREAQGVAHLAHRRARPVRHDVADHARVLRAVALVDVADHLLAAGRGEVDVDIGISGPALVEESLEQEVVPDRVDAGDPQDVGHDRVAGAASALGGDPTRLGEPHEIGTDEEELGQAGPLDDVELVRELAAHARRDGVVLRPRALLAAPRQVAEWRLTLRHCEAGEPVLLEPQVDRAARAEFLGGPQALGPRPAHCRIGLGFGRREGRQLGRRLQVVLGVRPAQVGALVERAAVADGDEHVRQFMVVPPRVVDIVRDDDRQAQLGGEPGRLGDEPVVIRQQVVLEFQEDAGAEARDRRVGRRMVSGGGGRARAIAGQQPPRDLRMAAARQRDEPVGVALQERVRVARHALRAGQVRRAHEPAQAAIARRIPGEQDEMRTARRVADAAEVLAQRLTVARQAQTVRVRPGRTPVQRNRCRLLFGGAAPGRSSTRHDEPMGVGDRRVEQLDLQTDDRAEPRRLGRRDEPDGAVEAPVVGDGEGREAQFERPGHQVLG